MKFISHEYTNDQYLGILSKLINVDFLLISYIDTFCVVSQEITWGCQKAVIFRLMSSILWCIKTNYNSSGCKQFRIRSCIITRRKACGVCNKKLIVKREEVEMDPQDEVNKPHPNNLSNEVTTRSGWVSRTPIRYNDYV